MLPLLILYAVWCLFAIYGGAAATIFAVILSIQCLGAESNAGIVFSVIGALWAPIVLRNHRLFRQIWQKTLALLFSAAVVAGFIFVAISKEITIDALPDGIKWTLIAAGGAWAGMKYLRSRR